MPTTPPHVNPDNATATLRLIHTADWHLGQTFFEYDRKAEHQQFLAWLKTQITALRADALLIAGDVFDTANPSAESQKVFYRFLKEITAENPQLQVVVTAGNHDSGARLEAPNPLLEQMNVTVRGTIKRTAEGEIDYDYLAVPLLKNGLPQAWCMAVPYLRQGDYPEAAHYAAGVGLLYETLYDKIRQKSLPIVAMGHLQATGSEVSEQDRSERTIIGGLEGVSPNSFAREIVYTALGHLHRAQRVSGRENVRYAGAPLPMSFAEKNNKQGITLVEIAGGTATIEHIAFEAPVQLLSIPPKPAPLQEVFAAIHQLPNGSDTANAPYLEIKILITEPEPSLRHFIEDALKGKAVRLARIAAVTPQQQQAAASATIVYEDLQTVSPFDMALDIFRKRYGGNDMPDSMKTLLQSVIQSVNEATL